MTGDFRRPAILVISESERAEVRRRYAGIFDDAFTRWEGNAATELREQGLLLRRLALVAMWRGRHYELTLSEDVRLGRRDVPAGQTLSFNDLALKKGARSTCLYECGEGIVHRFDLDKLRQSEQQPGDNVRNFFTEAALGINGLVVGLPEIADVAEIVKDAQPKFNG